MDLSNVNKATFPLPRLGSDLETLSSCVHEGRGFFVLRGLDPTLLSKEDNVVLYLGVSSYIAERRGRQNQDGMMLSNLIELHERINANLKAHITNQRIAPRVGFQRRAGCCGREAQRVEYPVHPKWLARPCGRKGS